jgi:hypothetical protein
MLNSDGSISEMVRIGGLPWFVVSRVQSTNDRTKENATDTQFVYDIDYLLESQKNHQSNLEPFDQYETKLPLRQTNYQEMNPKK